MLVVVSPAKKLDFESECSITEQTEPPFIGKTNTLAKELKKLTSNDIGKLMKLSLNLSDLNYGRFQSFKKTFNPSTSKQAVFAFNGDTYTGLDINSFTKSQVTQAQKKLRILSGLYGVLKPLDLIQPYRLEMGTKFKFSEYKNLYDYWKEDVTSLLSKELKKEKYLVNCASTEYFSVVDTKELDGEIITPVFKELRNGEYKIISFSAKRARGMMAKYIIQNKIEDIAGIKKFNLDNYKYNSKLSQDNEIVFTR
jgi:cytoplasmic iron level regulating protein YaaA (DUF328/UPF0246 family)